MSKPDSKNAEKNNLQHKRTLFILSLCVIFSVLVTLVVLILCSQTQENEADNTFGYEETIDFIQTTSVTTDATTQNTTSIEKQTTNKSVSATTKKEYTATDDDITCDELGRFSGLYVEDGSDEPIDNVAAMRVTNRSDSFLDIATITVNISGNISTFIVTGLPAKSSAWVLEANRMIIGETENFELIDCVSTFRENVISETDKIKITADGNMLTATNCSTQTLEDVFVYYRTLHTDNRFLGGITYAVSFGTLKPNESTEVLAGHYDSDSTKIVRIGWNER